MYFHPLAAHFKPLEMYFQPLAGENPLAGRNLLAEKNALAGISKAVKPLKHQVISANDLKAKKNAIRKPLISSCLRNNQKIIQKSACITGYSVYFCTRNSE